jgi:hypothetical protein
MRWAAIVKTDEEREQWLDEQCHNLKHKHGAALRILRELEQVNTRKMTPKQSKDLHACLTYFGNHLSQMRYARCIGNSIPIGSGVTELDFGQFWESPRARDAVHRIIFDDFTGIHKREFHSTKVAESLPATFRV